MIFDSRIGVVYIFWRPWGNYSLLFPIQSIKQICHLIYNIIRIWVVIIIESDALTPDICHIVGSEAHIFFPKPNMENPKSQHHRPCVWLPLVSGKLATLFHLLPLLLQQRSLPIFPPFLNSHIALRHITQCLKNSHDKTYKHYLHWFIYGLSFLIPLSTAILWTYETLNILGNSP